MDARIEVADGRVILHVTGEVDLYNVGALREALDQAIDKHKEPVDVHLGEVSYIDSTGIGALLNANTRLKKLNRALRFVATPDTVLEVFKLTKLDQFLTILR